MRKFYRFNLPFDSLESHDLQEWRTYILEVILRGVLFVWLVTLIGGVNNLFNAYKTEYSSISNPNLALFLILAIYLGTTTLVCFITFNRKLSYNIRAGIFLFATYVIGSLGLTLSSLSGDGRIFLFTFVILSAVFYDLRYSLHAFLLSLATILIISWLQLNGHLFVPPERQLNATDPGAWLSGTLVFILVSIAALISITYLLQVLSANLQRSNDLLKREQRLSQILRTVTDINQLIVREQDQGKLLTEACKRLISGRGYSFSWIGLLEPDNVTLKIAAQAGDTLEPLNFNARIDENASGPNCAINAIRMQATFRVHPDAENDPCLGCPRRIGSPNRSGVALPLLRDNRVLGVLVVDHTLLPGDFDEEEIQLLQDLANDLSYALEKIEANNRLQVYSRHQDLLNEITRVALEITDLETMLRKLIKGLEKALRADEYYFMLWNEERKWPEKFIGSDGLAEVLAAFNNVPVGEKIFSISVLEAGHVLVVDDVMDSAYINPQLAERFPIRAAIGMPLIAEEKKFGAFILGFHESYVFSADEIELAEQASRQIALAMLKAKLDSDTRAKAAELERLYAAAQDMASSLLDAPALLKKLAYHMTEALQITSGNIMSVNLADGTMEVVGEYWSDQCAPAELHSDLGKVYPTDDFATIIKVMAAGDVIVMHCDDENMTEAERNQFIEYDIRSMMFVPIMARGQLFGNIELWESRHRREFSEADIRLAKAMAGHTASVIENANLVNAVKVSEIRYRGLVEQASDGIFLVHPNQYFVDVNPSGCAMLGYSAEEILKLKITDILMLENDDDKDKLFDDLLAGKAIIIERVIKRKDGSILPVEVSAKILPSGFFQGIVRDISERKQTEEALAEREAYFRALIENSAEGVAIIDVDGIVRYIAPSDERLTGYSSSEVQGQSAFRYIHPQDIAKLKVVFNEGVTTPGAVRTTGYRLKHKNGEWRYFEITGHNMLSDPHISGIVVNYRDVTERRHADQALQESQARLEAIIASALNGIITINEDQIIVLFNPSAERIFGYSSAEVLGQPLERLIPQRYHHSHSRYVEDYSTSGKSIRKKGLLDSLYGKRADGEEFPMEAFLSNSEVDGKKFYTVIFQDITERRQSEDALRESERKFRTLAENIPSVVYQCKNDLHYTMIYLNDSIEALTGYSKEDFLEGRLSFFDLYHPDDQKKIPVPSKERPHLNSSQFHITYRIRHKSGEWRWVDEWGAGVLDNEGTVQYLEGVMVDVTEQKRAEEDLRRHAMELETLAAASSALRTAQNVSEMVPILARHALRAVGGTYASIFLLDAQTGEFVSHGWFSEDAREDFSVPDESRLRHAPNQGITGRVAATGEIYISEDIQKDPVIVILEAEQKRLKGVHGGISLPLREQEKIIGVMHIWSAEPRIFNDSDIRLLTALAETTGNSIHRSILFEQTQRHADELAMAYDNTLAGWARALELRDELTEGHTRRVTELTLKLADALHIPENEKIHIRRGALLHDIGKMGIPDSILHKPGAFTAQERKIMQQHTQYAYDMLISIPFLQAAIDIPYCHHEHWNGAGYPRGLKGEEIPLAARIFSVVDVWDALTSDRPYREAWSKARTRDYILERVGTQFDPRVVEVFFSLMFAQ